VVPRLHTPEQPPRPSPPLKDGEHIYDAFADRSLADGRDVFREASGANSLRTTHRSWGITQARGTPLEEPRGRRETRRHVQHTVEDVDRLAVPALLVEAVSQMDFEVLLGRVP
jgi:hypothetical protein